ncbi:MAG: EAL domain-containing protein, partial [Leptospiraceae bacterium]|nr:EAL domain-containing protein [Leptospiraceae bacterium]
FLILYGGPHDQVDECAGHILTSMRTVFSVESVYLYCTVSIGITLINHDIHRPNRLIQNAEIAVRLAHEKGGDQVQHYSDDAHIDTAVSIQIGQDLRRAIENDEFSVVYQPTVDAQTGKWRALEALMRWHHPHIGLLMPGRFLHVAEKLGLMRHIDQLIARRIRTETAEILDKTDWRIQINCSGINIDAPYIDFLIEVLEPQRFPGRFTIEITEHMLLGNSAETIRLVERMQAVGFQIALDDFGTGYSSLAYLQRLPIDYLKIDRTFVANMFTAEGAAMLHAIINLAANLHMQTIAEGVETDEQRKTLAELLCTELQGYFFQRPVPIDQLPVSLN